MNKRKLKPAFLVLALWLGPVPGNRLVASGQQVAPLPIEDALRMRRLGASDRAFSPDNKWLAFAAAIRNTKTPAGGEDDSFLPTGLTWDGLGSDVWVTSTATRESRNLTKGRGNSWFPAWSPDSKFLAFISDRDKSGQAQLWVWDVGKEQLRKVSDVAVRMPGPQQIEWTPDSREVLVTAVPAGLPVSEYLRRLTSRDVLPSPGIDRVTGTTRTLYRSSPVNGLGALSAVSDPLQNSFLAHDVVLVDVATGNVRTLVHDELVAAYHLSADGTKLAYSVVERFERAGSQQRLFQLRMMNLATRQVTPLASGIHLDLNGTFSLSPDAMQLGFRATETEKNTLDIFTIDSTGGVPRNLTQSSLARPLGGETHSKLRWSFSTTLFWDRESRNIYFVAGGNLWKVPARAALPVLLAKIPERQIRQLIAAHDGTLAASEDGRFTIVIARDEALKRDGFYQVDLQTGQVRKLLERQECYTCSAGPRGHLATVAGNRALIAYTAEDAEHPEEVWLTDLGFNKLTKVTSLNGELSKYRMGAGRIIEWLDDDGKLLHGSLLLPSTYIPGQRVPLLVLVYGGEASSDAAEKFGGYDRTLPYLNLQLLATRGYAVLTPDAPQHMGTPMLDLVKTILPGVNKTIEMGIADPERLGVLGHSYGGYSTLSLLVQTTRFKAAMESAGIGNLFGLYGEMNKDGTAYGTSIETGQMLVGGSPWQYRNRYLENSPVFYLDRVDTPLLIIHGTDDTAVSPFLGDELFVGLRRLGKVVEYAKYSGEDHVFVGYGNQLDVAQRMIAWFDKYLKGTASPLPSTKLPAAN